jgi:hypothetical protein
MPNSDVHFTHSQNIPLLLLNPERRPEKFEDEKIALGIRHKMIAVSDFLM